MLLLITWGVGGIFYLTCDIGVGVVVRGQGLSLLVTRGQGTNVTHYNL